MKLRSSVKKVKFDNNYFIKYIKPTKSKYYKNQTKIRKINKYIYNFETIWKINKVLNENEYISYKIVTIKY